MGYLPQVEGEVLWMHGASAGEMGAATALASVLTSNGFNCTPAYTAANRAGVDYLRRHNPDNKLATLAPWDTSACIARALDRWHPRALLLVETELWPRMVFEAYLRDIPVFSVSARIFPGDMPRYKMVRSFISRTLRRISAILAQDEVERQRFIDLGAPPERCLVAGNLKYAAIDRRSRHDVSVRSQLGLSPADAVVIFGSLHRDEIGMLLETIARLIDRGVRVIVAPRHLASADLLVQEAQRREWRYGRRSEGTLRQRWQLLILDTIGELARFYSAASCAVVGGGFGRHGGHNPFEPVRSGVPVAFGPHFHHFDSEARALAAATPQASLAEAAQAARLLDRWLDDEVERLRALELQRTALPDGEAIAARYVETLKPWLGAAA